MKAKRYYYYSVDTKSDQYSTHIRGIKKTTKAKVMLGVVGIEDSQGYQTYAYCATTASVKKFRGLMEGEFQWRKDNSAEVDGIRIERLF